MPTRAPAKKAPLKTPSPVKSSAAKSTRKKAADAQPQPAADHGEKPAKVKLVRDSFTIPKSEYAIIDQLKQRAAKSSLPSKKSELLRAGLMALAAMEDAAFKTAVSAVPTLKTGRPKKP